MKQNHNSELIKCLDIMRMGHLFLHLTFLPPFMASSHSFSPSSTSYLLYFPTFSQLVYSLLCVPPAYLLLMPPEQPYGPLRTVDQAGEVEEGVLRHKELLVPRNFREGL